MACGMYYLKELSRRGLFRGAGVRVLDIGTQNLLAATPDDILEFARAHGSRLPDAELAARATGLAARSEFGHPAGTTYLGEVFDLTAVGYETVDIFNGYRTRIFDLNVDPAPEDYRGAFDIVLNFGTTEHVVNQYNCFKVIHECTKPGGAMFHQVPSTGYCDHCYFLYNPRLFFDLADANGYHVVDLWFTGPQSYVKLPDTLGWPRRGQAGPRPDCDETAWARADIPNAVINVLFRKQAPGPFRLSLETSTTSGALDGAISRRYASSRQAQRPAAPGRLRLAWRTIRDALGIPRL